jgi:serine/threonine-protein kinase
VAAALDAAHADGLVHRDVKPENVLLTPDNFAYLVDFGIADAGGDASAMASEPIIGSCAYMAPERFGGGRVGPQADVYSLACMLYECLTGRPPFERPGVQELMTAHKLWPPPRPSIMRRGIGRAFDDVIDIGMAKQPAARFSSAGELATAATAIATSDQAPPPAAVPPSRPSTTQQFSAAYPDPNDTGSSPYPPLPARLIPARRPRFGRAPVVLAGVAVVLLIAAAVMAGILALRTNGNGSAPETPVAAPPAASNAPATTTPSLSHPVKGADGLGFVGHTARCDPGNPPAAVVRTAKSLAVICQSGDGSFYYRGERLSDGANIELANAERTSGGFDVTNPANGVRYEVSPHRLRIISNGHVDTSERVLQYATAT